ncbi:MAG: hypothetical protein Q9208_006431 [Pyrenodesmia sp. 3 TL-2023]
MKHKHEADILSELVDLTKATPVVATPEEEAELQQLADEQKRAAADRMRNAAYTEQKRQEKALLDQARGAKILKYVCKAFVQILKAWQRTYRLLSPKSVSKGIPLVAQPLSHRQRTGNKLEGLRDEGIVFVFVGHCRIRTF